MTTRQAIIPARGGSTRLLRKNVHPLGGKPLVCHTVEAVIESGKFDSVIVSTDCPDIAAAAKSCGDVEIYDRPAKYSGARVTVVEAILAMMAEIPKHDIIAYFLPTCPFRNAEDIRAGAELLTEDTDSVISISRYSEPPQLAMVQCGDDVVPVFDNLKAGVTNSKYITHYVKPNGGFYMGWWDRVLENGNFFTGRIKGSELPKQRSVDIDDELDINFAELVWQRFIQNEAGPA